MYYVDDFKENRIKNLVNSLFIIYKKKKLVDIIINHIKKTKSRIKICYI